MRYSPRAYREVRADGEHRPPGPDAGRAGAPDAASPAALAAAAPAIRTLLADPYIHQRTLQC